MTPPGNLLVVDDEQGIRDLLQFELGARGHQVHTAADGGAAVALLQQREFDLVISDVRMPGRDGLEVLRATKATQSGTEVIIISGYAELESAIACVRAGAFDLLPKPFLLPALLESIDRALSQRQVRDTAELLRASSALFSKDQGNTVADRLVHVSAAILRADGARFVPEGQEAEPGLPERALRVDLVSAGQRLGTLALDRAAQSPPFTSRCAEMAGVLVTQAALAMVNERLTAQLMSQERLAVVGQLTSSVAHELNNPITYVEFNARFAREALRGCVERHPSLEPELAEAEQALADVCAGAARLKEIVSDLRGLSRKGQGEGGSFVLADAVRSGLRLAAPLARGGVQISQELDGAVEVEGHAGHLGQVVLNLVANAVQAIRESGRPTGRIEVRLTSAGGHALLEVQDDGPGIPKELQEKIFEPFFTTREKTTGTGLGLALCRDLVHRHQGTITVASAPGEGATFTVRLPLAGARQHED